VVICDIKIGLDPPSWNRYPTLLPVTVEVLMSPDLGL